ncbi:NADH-quinone oxidoreductase subunit C [Gemmatimonas groenlandica]|uniref:NADH-quinone oxidoreductase subunit C n=1 Tax=Gemmatimonas groenlandica TaxID=2732249 RepID=A0A6M4IQW6_9BACT|nr:NADH-quinone oxidoreductase subunit C [Gemmatimonas groenlandica]
MSAAPRNGDRWHHATAGKDRQRQASHRERVVLIVTTPFLDLVEQQFAPSTGIESHGVQHGVLVLHLEPAALLPVAERLKSQFAFDLFLDVTAIDWPDDALRFEVVHHFYSTTHKVRVRLKTRVSASDPTVDTLTSLFGSAGYMERECHDMYGIVFRGNDDLRPILLYEGFSGHPLRKDYPKQLEQPLVPYRPPQGTLVR